MYWYIQWPFSVLVMLEMLTSKTATEDIDGKPYRDELEEEDIEDVGRYDQVPQTCVGSLP